MSSLTSKLRAGFAAVALAAVAVLGFAAPASAHDVVVSTSPADGTTVTEVPTSVSFEFSGEIFTDGIAISVTGPGDDTTEWATGEPTAEGFTVSSPVVEGMANGVYTVSARVVSSDGHPTDASFTFTLDAPIAMTEEPEQTPAATEEATASAEPSATPEATETSAATEEQGSSVLAWGIVAGVVLLVLIALIAVTIARKKKA